MQNIEAILASKRCEILTVGGVAENVVTAEIMAWSGLRNVLGPDPEDAWVLKTVIHSYVVMAEGKPGVQFQAEFVRRPEEES
jgi:hypothetical protein